MSNKLHMYNNGDPAGLVPEEELMELTSNEDPTGGATPTVTTSSYPCIGIITRLGLESSNSQYLSSNPRCVW